MRRYACISIVILLIFTVGSQSFKHVGTQYATSTVSARVEVSAYSHVEWNKTYGGTGSDFSLALVQATDGGYALAGRTYSFGAGSSDIWLVKTDALGNHLWNRTYGGTRDDRTSSLVHTADGGYVLAGTTYSFGAGSSDIWLVKTDAFGNNLWNKTYGGTREDDPAHFLVQTVDGGYALAGRTYSFGAGSSDIWLVKTDASGNHLWNRTYGGTNMDGVFAFVQTVDGGYALAGHTNSFGAGNYDYWLIKTDSAGNMVWNKTYGGTNEDWAYALVQTVDGGYAIVGETRSFGAGESDIWLVRTDASGNHLWNRTYGGTNMDGVFALVQTVGAGYAIAGHTYSFGAGSSDAWLVKTSADGNHEWNETYGGGDEDYACRLIPTGDHGYVLAGSTKSFGAGNDDFWLVKALRGVSTIVVPDDYPKIQEAINNAADGDTVFVKAGTYYEHVVVNKTVALVGDNMSTTIIDGNDTGNVVYIVRNDVNLTGFTIRNSGHTQMPDLEAGICLNGTTGCMISDNRLVDNGFSGISLLYSQYNKIVRNSVNHTEWGGIHLLGSSQNLVSGNVVDNTTHEYGVGINGHASSNYNNINGNTISNSRYGSFYHASSYNNICGNNISNIEVGGIWLQDQVNYNLVAENNLINNTVAIRIEGPNYNNTLSRNVIIGAEYGIRVQNSARYTRIVDNIIVKNRAGNDSWSAGIRLDSGLDSQIDSNTVAGNNYGVLLYSTSPRVSIYNNTITDNEFGIRVANGGSNYVNISDNVVMNNLGYGIGLTGFGSGSNYATVSRNLIVNNSDGIVLGQSSSYHQIFRNNISENGYGFYIEYSAQNTIWGNNIISNGQQVYISESSVNNWNSSYPTGGNYWSDYSAVDFYGGPGQNEAGSDETGDVPYVINADNTDRYPLMRLWIPFNNQAIVIRGDGGIDPSGAPIRRRGDLYTLTGNIASDADGLVIERDGVILDGAGFELLGGQSGGVGIDLTGRSNVTIKNLKIADFGCGALLDSSSGNTFCHSSFVNNTLQINNLTPGQANSWDNGCEGNYWSDYAARYPEASQVNSTGIWDTPYKIDANNIDRFPLMNVYWNPCDINHDLKVNMKDIGAAAIAFGTVPGDFFWNPHVDITGGSGASDGKVDMRDIGLIARAFGLTYPTSTSHWK